MEIRCSVQVNVLRDRRPIDVDRVPLSVVDLNMHLFIPGVLLLVCCRNGSRHVKH
jgi:hypothetical protein